MNSFFDLHFKTAEMLIEAGDVFNRRMLGMAGILPSESDETTRMVTEKQNVFAQATLAATGAMLSGMTPMQAYGLALEPIGVATQANSARLSKKD